MLGKKLRNRLSGFFALLAKPLSILPISPNKFTFLAVPLSITAAWFIYSQNLALALAFVILAVMVDVLDGSFAERKKMKSSFGNYFDAVIDKVVECAFYIGFVFLSPLMAILALAGTMLESYAKPRVGLVIVTDNHDWKAIGERSDRLLALIIGMAIAVLIPQNQEVVISAVLGIIFAMTMTGFVQRVHYAKKLIKKAEKEGNLLPYLKKKTTQNP